MASEIAERAIERYTNEEIDSVYLVYNEFKSVIAQRLVVEQVLPIEHIGEPRCAPGRGHDAKRKRRRAIEAAKGTGVGLRPADTTRSMQQAAKFAHGSGGLHLRAIAGRIVSIAAAEIRSDSDFSRLAGIGGSRTCGAHDCHGVGNQQRNRHD